MTFVKKGFYYSVVLSFPILQLGHLIPQQAFTPEGRPQLLLMALEQGFSPDRDLQRRALNYIANDLLLRPYPRLRVVFNAAELPRVLNALAAHPLQFVLQVFLGGTNQMFVAARKQPRGPAAKIAPIAAIIRLLACLADEVISRDQEVFQRIQALAHQEGGYGVNAMSVTKLEALYFLVGREMKKTWGYAVEDVQPYDRNFARTYLYPYKAQYRAVVARCFEVPGIWQRLLGL